jgi:hypothetical protein
MDLSHYLVTDAVASSAWDERGAPAYRVAPRGRSRHEPVPIPPTSHPPLSPRCRRRAPPGKARAVPAAAGLSLPARLGDPAGQIWPAAVRLGYCPLSGEVDLGWRSRSPGRPGRWRRERILSEISHFIFYFCISFEFLSYSVWLVALKFLFKLKCFLSNRKSKKMKDYSSTWKWIIPWIPQNEAHLITH